MTSPERIRSKMLAGTRCSPYSGVLSRTTSECPLSPPPSPRSKVSPKSSNRSGVEFVLGRYVSTNHLFRPARTDCPVSSKGVLKALRFASLLGFLLALGAVAHSGQKEPPIVKLQQAVCGALLRDDFSSPTVNQCLWHLPLEDPGIRVTIDKGELCIRGTSAPIPEELLRKEIGKLWRFAGVTSRRYPQTDVSLAVRVKMPSGISQEPGLHGVCVHLCGVEPDTYPEVLFGKVEGNATQEILHQYNRGTPDDVPYPDARGWFLGVINQDQGDNLYLIAGRPLPEVGDERKEFHDVLIDYDAQLRSSRAFLKVAGRWVELGKAEPLIRGLTAVELKIMDVTPLYGAYREARFDDCRLYPYPRRHPIRFIAVSGSYHVRYHGPGLRVALYTADGAHQVSEGYLDGYGMVNLSVDSPLWVAFPVSAMVRIFRDQKELARSFIEARGVDGLYPGDVWVLDTNQIR